MVLMKQAVKQSLCLSKTTLASIFNKHAQSKSLRCFYLFSDFLLSILSVCSALLYSLTSFDLYNYLYQPCIRLPRASLTSPH